MSRPHPGSYLAHSVGLAAERFGDRPAFVDADGTVVTFFELHRRSEEVAAGLARRGIGPGSVVGATLASTSTWVVAYVAVAKAGAAMAGVNPLLTGVEQQACLDQVAADLVLADPDEVERLSVRGGSAPTVDLPADHPAVIVFTSGTTGSPKGAWFTDRQLRAVTRFDVGRDLEGPLEARDPRPHFASTQFAHVGFATKLPWYLRLGFTTHLLARWRAADVLDLIERVRISTIGGVAPQLSLLLRDPDFDRRDLSSVRSIVMGGAPSPPALVLEARRRFHADYSIRWSSTESGGIGTKTAPDDPDHEALHSVGRARPGMDVTVRDRQGEVLPAGEVGEVWLRSEAVMAGYWNNPDATAEVLVNDWLRTGDLGHLAPEGYLMLDGRQGEMYIRGGYNVFPSEVAARLIEDPAVADAVVVPRADPVLGEIGVAIIVPTDPATPPSLEDLRTGASDRLARHKLPEDLVVVDRLPLTAMQKIDRRALRDLVAGDATVGPEDPPTRPAPAQS